MTINEQVVQSIIAEIRAIQQSIRDKSLDQYALQQLFQREQKLQEKLNNLLNRKGLLNKTEADKIYEELRLEKEQSLMSKLGKGYTWFIVAGVVIAVGLYFAFKKK